MGSPAGVPLSDFVQPAGQSDVGSSAQQEDSDDDSTASLGVDDLTWSEVADAVWLTSVTEDARRASDSASARRDGASYSASARRDATSYSASARRDAVLEGGEQPPQRNTRPADVVPERGPDVAPEPGAFPADEPAAVEPPGWVLADAQPVDPALHLVPTDPIAAARPVVALLPDSAAIVRALRPLKRKVRSRRRDDAVLDEVGTAERAVQDGLWLPVTKPGTVRWLDLTLVVDVGPSMSLWRSTVAGFVSVVRQLGAFRTIQVRQLDSHRPSPVLRGGTATTPVRGPAELLDPSGRRIVLVLTDGVGESWWQGQVGPLLALWGAAMPVAVVQLLPQRMWDRGGLALRRARLTVPAPLRPNRRWELALSDAWLEPVPTTAVPGRVVPVPVLELRPRWLGWWARLITGVHRGPSDATVLLARSTSYTASARRDAISYTASARRDADAPPAAVHDGSAEPSPGDRVAHFVGIASPSAFRLATLLAAVPVSLPVARFVQAELVPGSGPDDLAEVFTSGLLRPSDNAAGDRGWDTLAFDFPESVREVLLSGARRSETAQVVRMVAGRFGNQFGVLTRLRDALADPDSTSDPLLTQETAAEIALERTVLRALSGPYLSRADRLHHLIEYDETPPVSSRSTTSPTTAIPKNPVSDMSNVAERADVPNEPDSTAKATPEHSEIRSVRLGEPRPGQPEDRPPAGLTGGFGALVGSDTPAEGIPPVWGNVPPRNPNFTGRAELLEQLSKRLVAGGTTAVLPAALHGMGGIGKTQMAVEYIYRRLHDYDIVWWVQATQPAQIRSGLTELAQYLRLPGSGEANTAVPAVREALRRGQPFRRWLLVFDSAESPEVVRPFFPTNGPGEILITSRNPDWAGIARPLEVEIFKREESVELLRRRGPDISDEDAGQLAAKLGDLPLAIEQAAAWRAETGMPVHEYLRLFDEKVEEILDTSAPADYELSVAAAWNVSFDVLETRSPAAHQLLQVCAFFAPEPISRSLFTGVRGVSISAELDAALRDPMRLSRAIRDINRYGLAKIDHRSDTILLHRLVQVVLRNRMSSQRRADMRHGAHVLLANFDPNDPSSSKLWPRYQDVLPHIYSAELTECDDPWVRQLLVNLMQFLYYWGDHVEATALAREAIEKWSATVGETDLHALQAATYLGMYLWALGQFTEAAEINQRTLELRRQVSGENSEETIFAQLRVAGDLKARGDFNEARDYNEQIYQKAKGLFGNDDPITLQTAHDLAVSVRLCGDYARAFELDDYTYQRRAEVLGYDNMDTLNTLSGVVIDRRELGDYPLARVGHEQVAERVREVLGDDKADTLRRFLYLAVARRKDGDHAGALELSSQALQLFRRRYGNDHPNAMACAIAQSIDLRQSGDLEAARALGEQTFDRYRTKLGEHHPHTLSAAVDLAVTLRLRGDAAGARQLNERSFEQLRAALGPDHPHAIVCAIDLASDLSALGESEAAYAFGSEALARSTRTLGEDHPTSLAASLNVALDLRALGRSQEAETQYADVLTRYRRVLGEAHPGTIAAVRGVRADCDIDPMPG